MLFTYKILLFLQAVSLNCHQINECTLLRANHTQCLCKSACFWFLSLKLDFWLVSFQRVESNLSDISLMELLCRSYFENNFGIFYLKRFFIHISLCYSTCSITFVECVEIIWKHLWKEYFIFLTEYFLTVNDVLALQFQCYQ